MAIIRKLSENSDPAAENHSGGFLSIIIPGEGVSGRRRTFKLSKMGRQGAIL